MKQTLTNIDARIILKALRSANPVTAAGKAAVENYRNFLTVRTMNAIALESSIVSLQQTVRDAGLSSLVATLKGIMPEQKRRVAVAYEQLAAKPAGLFMGASEECMAALEGLYERNATEIIEAINGGVLNAYATVPEVASLIRWAKTATKAEPAKRQLVGVDGVNVTMVPVLRLASAGEDLLVSIDGRAFLQSKSGALTYVPDASSMTAIPDDVRKLIKVISMFHTDGAEPNLLVLNEEYMEYVRKVLPVKKIAIDLLGGVNELVLLNNDAMDVDKAIRLLMSDNDKLIASVVLDDGAREAISILSEAFRLFERYRDIIASNKFAYKFAGGDKFAMYVVDNGGNYNAIVVVNGSVVSAKRYNSIYDIIADDMVVTNSPMHTALSASFASQLENEAKRMSVKKRIIEELTDERRKYSDLLDNINASLSELAEVTDVNTDKVDQLTELKKRAEEKLATISDEIGKLA